MNDELGRTEQQIEEQASRHPSAAVTKATLKDFCLNGEDRLDLGRQESMDKEDGNDGPAGSAGSVRAPSAADLKELADAYRAWDNSTVDYQAMIDLVQEKAAARAAIVSLANEKAALRKDKKLPRHMRNSVVFPSGIHSGTTSVRQDRATLLAKMRKDTRHIHAGD